MHGVIRVQSFRFSATNIEAVRILKDKVIVYLISGRKFIFTDSKVVEGFKQNDAVNWSALATYIYPRNMKKMELTRNRYHAEIEKEKREDLEEKAGTKKVKRKG